MASYNECKNFIKDVIPEDLLDMAIDWIQSNMEPSEVFDESKLKEWAEDNDYVKEEG